MTDAVVVINSPVSTLGKLFYNTQTYLDLKTEQLEKLSNDAAAARLDNLQADDFYTFSDLELLFMKADLRRDGTEQYKYKTYDSASRLLNYLANSHDKLSAMQINAMFNRFQLSDSDLIQLFKSFPHITQQLSPGALLGYAKLSKRLAQYILSTPELCHVLDQNKYARTLIYQSHPASLWLCERVFGIETDVEDIHKLNHYLTNDLRADLPNLEAIDAIVRRRKDLEIERDDLEKRLISLNLFLDAVKAHANAKTAERKAAAKQWLDSLQLRFPTIRAEVRFINHEIKLTVRLQKAKQEAINATLPELRTLCKNAQLGKYTLDIFLRRQASAEEVEQSRQNLLDLIKVRPNYMTLIDVRHIAAMFAIAHHEKEADKENTLLSIISYLCSHPHTLAQLTEYLTQTSRNIAAKAILVNEIDSNAFKIITRFIYHDGLLFSQEKPNGLKILSKYPALGKAIYELHPERLDKIDRIPDSHSRLNFLHTNRSNFSCEHLLNINMALLDPKERKLFFYNGAKDHNRVTPLDKLRKGIDMLITNGSAPREISEPIDPPAKGSVINGIILSEKDHRLLLNAMREDDLRSWINLARGRSDDNRNYIELWLNVTPHGVLFNEDVSKTIALDPNLLNALRTSPIFETIKNNNKYIFIADFVHQRINSYNRWTVSRQKDDFIQDIIREIPTVDNWPFDREILKDCICWYIANDEDLWQRMLKAKVYNSGWWWGPSQESINQNLLDLKKASDHFRQRVDRIAPNLSSAGPRSNSPKSNVDRENDPQDLRRSRASSDGLNSAHQSDIASQPGSANGSLKNSPRIDEPPAKSSPRLIVPDAPLSGQKLSPRHADAPQPIGFDVRMNVVDFAARLLEPRSDDELRKMASHNKEHVRQRYDAEWSAARLGTTVSVKAELLKHWPLYETFLTERAKQGKIQDDELGILLQLKLPTCQNWLANFYSAHVDNIELVYQLFTASNHDAELFNNNNYQFYLSLFEAKELTPAELERYYALDIFEIDQAFGRVIKPEIRTFLKSKFALENRANVSRRVALFEHLAGDLKMDAASRLKFFTAEGVTNSQRVKGELIRLCKAEPDIALSFLRAADQNIINQNLAMFLSVLDTKENVHICHLTSDDCLKLYNTGSVNVMGPLFANKAYFEAIMGAITVYPDDQLDIMLKLISNGCSYILEAKQLRTLLSNRVISLCVHFDENRLLLIKLFEIPEAQMLFSRGDINVISALAMVDSIIVAHNLIATFSSSAAFGEFIKSGAAAAAVENNNCFATVALSDNNLRQSLFIDNKDNTQCSEQLLALYKRNNPDLTNQLLGLYERHKISAFNLEALTGEDLRDLYFAQGACFAGLANNCIFTNDTLRKKFIRVLDKNQAAEFISDYLLERDSDLVAAFFKHEDLLPLLKGIPLMKLLKKNIHFARQALMNRNLRQQLELTSSHFYYMVNLLSDADLKQFLSDAPDKQFISHAFKDAIIKGHSDKIEMFLNNFQLRNLIDCNIVCNDGVISVATLQNLPWTKTSNGIKLMNIVISKFFEKSLPEQRDISKIQICLGDSEERLAALNVRLQNAIAEDKPADAINAIKNEIKTTYLSMLSYLYELLEFVQPDDSRIEDLERKVSEYGLAFTKIFGDSPIESLVKYCLDPSHYAPHVLTKLLRKKDESQLNDIGHDELKIMLNDPLLCSFLTPDKIRSIAKTPEIALYCITHQHVLEVLKSEVFTLIEVAKKADLGNDHPTTIRNLLALRPICAMSNGSNNFGFLRSTLEREINGRSSMAGAASSIANIRSRDGLLSGGASPSSGQLLSSTSQAGSPRDQRLSLAIASPAGTKPV